MKSVILIQIPVLQLHSSRTTLDLASVACKPKAKSYALIKKR